MDKKQFLNDIVRVANYLDQQGMTKEADVMDKIMTKVAEGEYEDYLSGVDDYEPSTPGFESPDVIMMDEDPDYEDEKTKKLEEMGYRIGQKVRTIDTGKTYTLRGADLEDGKLELEDMETGEIFDEYEGVIEVVE